MTNTGTVWSGSYCIPKEATINCFGPINGVETKRLTFDPAVGKFDEKLYSKVQQAVVYNKDPRLEMFDRRVSPTRVTEPNHSPASPAVTAKKAEPVLAGKEEKPRSGETVEGSPAAMVITASASLGESQKA